LADKAVAKLLAQKIQVKHSHRLNPLLFHGYTMDPMLQEGDQVIVEPLNWEDIQIGDIVTYCHLDCFPSRRVVKKHRNHLMLWCDNWHYKRFVVTPERILGRVVSRRRGGTVLHREDSEWDLLKEQALLIYRNTRFARFKHRIRESSRALIGKKEARRVDG